MNTKIENFTIEGYVVLKNVVPSDVLKELQEDFHHTVHQLKNSGEDINAQWSGKPVEDFKAKPGIVIHTHNIQKFSATWMREMVVYHLIFSWEKVRSHQSRRVMV